MKRKIKRLLCVIIVCAYCVQAATSAFALSIDSNSTDWIDAVGGTPVATAFHNTIQENCNAAKTGFDAALKSPNKSLSTLLMYYGIFAANLDWMSRQVFYEENDKKANVPGTNEEMTSSAKPYAIWELPLSPEGVQPVPTADVTTLMGYFAEMTEALLSSEVPETDVGTSFIDGTWDLSQSAGAAGAPIGCLSSFKPQGTANASIMDSPGGFLGETMYRDRVKAILAVYCDGTVMATLANTAKDVGAAGGWGSGDSSEEREPGESAGNIATPLDTSFTESTSYTELISAIDRIFCLDQSKNVYKIEQLLAQNRDKLVPVLNAFNSIRIQVATLQQLHCSSYTAADGKVYISRYRASDVIDAGVSRTTKALANYVANSSITDSVLNPDDGGGVSVDTTFGALGLISNGKLSGTDIVVNGTAELTNIGYVLLAAGAIYDPFVSIAGNETYLSVIKGFLENPEKYNELVSVLQVAINTKKPLYVTEDAQSEWKNASELSQITLAEYRYARLADVLAIDESKTKAYAVIRGKMTPSGVDGSTWEYVNSGVSTDFSGSLTESVVQDDNAPGTSESGDNATGDGLKTVGSDTISASSQQMSDPVMITSGHAEGFLSNFSSNDGYPAAVGGLTSLILHNAAQDARDNKYLKDKDTQMLFMNGLGDIVLANNVVVLPAIANPILYYYGDKYNGVSDEDFMLIFNEDSEDYNAYYPYTASFMNHYPVARIDEDSSLSVSDAKDIDKYLICVNSGTLFARRIDHIESKSSKAMIRQDGSVNCAQIFGKCFATGTDASDRKSPLILGKGSGGARWFNYIASLTDASLTVFSSNGPVRGTIRSLFGGTYDTADGGSDAAGTVHDINNVLFMTRGTVLAGGTIPYFPLEDIATDVRDDYLVVARSIVTSALRFMAKYENTLEVYTSSGHLLIDHYVRMMAGQGLLGTQYSETIMRNNQVSYEDLVADQGGRILAFLTQLVDTAMGSLGSIDGVLAIKGPYDNAFFNVIVNFIQNFYLLIAVVLLIIVAVKFLKGHYNILYVAFLALICIAGFEVYATWLPQLVPSVYNFAVNDIIEDIVWNTVQYKAESYAETYKDSSRKDATSGKPRPYTSTITLYNLSNAEMELVARQVNVSDSEIRKGTTVYLDDEAGIFLQGNQVRMSLDKLLVNNTMRGLYQSQWDNLDAEYTDYMAFAEVNPDLNGNPYSIQLTQSVVSLEAYYTPYDHIQRTFMKQLNMFASFFRIERNALSYDNGSFYKDSFLVQAFIGSGIFTDPGNDATLANNIGYNSLLGGYTMTTDQIIEYINEAFYPQEDWLGLRRIFATPDVGMRDSMWGRIMQRRGWYDDTWRLTDKGDRHISDLIYYINAQTKQWVIKNYKNISFMSDENSLKLISLYATTCFTHYVSEFGEWLSPNYLNASDIMLKDVLYGSMTTLEDRNFSYDGTVTNTIALNLGFFGVLFILLIVILSAVFIFVITYLVPVLYGLLGGIIIFKLINDEDGVGLVKGYVKVTVTTAVLYTGYSLGLQLVKVGGYSWYSYLGCVLVTAFCVYMLFWTVLSVTQDLGELGNNTLQNNLLHGLKNLVPKKLRQADINTTNLFMRGHNRYGDFYNNSYRRSYDIDSYGAPVGSRDPYGRFEPSMPFRESSYAYRRGANSFGYGRDDIYDEEGFVRKTVGDRIYSAAGSLRRGWNSRNRRGNSVIGSDNTGDSGNTEI